MTRAALLAPGDSAWTGFLARVPHDVYHLPEYLTFTARHEGGTPVAFLVEEGEHALLAPLLLRALPRELGAPPDARDAATPYGYPGPLVTPGADEATLERLVAGLRDALAASGAVAALLRLHPFLALPEAPLARQGELVVHGETVWIDLTRPLDELNALLRRGHRNGARDLRAGGFTVVFDRWELLDRFVELYHMTMSRAGADERYFFSREYFFDLRAALGERLQLACTLAPDGDVAAALLHSGACGMVQGLFSATHDAYREHAPGKLATLAVRDFWKERSFRLMHLGGGVGAAADPLLHYKAGFSKERAKFATYRLVLDEPSYAALVARSGAERVPGGYFPAYRQPPRARASEERRVAP